MCKISIITIVFNNEKTIERCIKSVLNQKYNNIEYIIIDGGSTDRTLEIINCYNDKIHKIVSEKDKGIGDAFNKGIKLASGDVICMINSDDIMFEGAAQKIASEYDGITDVYYGDVVIINENVGSRCHQKPLPIQNINHTLPFSHQSTYITKEAYNKYGLYSLEYKICMDYELLLRMYTKSATFKYVPAILSEFYTGGVSGGNHIKTAKDIKNISILYGLSKFNAYVYFCKYVIRGYLHNILVKIGLLKYIQRIRINKRVHYEW